MGASNDPRLAPSPPFGRYFPTSGEELPSEQDSGGQDGDDPDRSHRDEKWPDRVAVRVRHPVECLEDRDGAVDEEEECNADTGEGLPAHLERNGRPRARIVLDMAPFFGFHMPNYTFPGIPDDRLFDHVVEQARAAEARSEERRVGKECRSRWSP